MLTDRSTFETTMSDIITKGRLIIIIIAMDATIIIIASNVDIKSWGSTFKSTLVMINM